MVYMEQEDVLDVAEKYAAFANASVLSAMVTLPVPGIRN